MVVNSPLRSTDSMPHAVSGVARAKLDKVVCHKVPASRVRAKVDGVVCLKVPASRVRHKVDRVKVNRVRVAQVRAMALEKAKATRPAVGSHKVATDLVPKAKGKVTPLETSAHAGEFGTRASVDRPPLLHSPDHS